MSQQEFDRRYKLMDFGRVVLIMEHTPPYWCNRRLGPILNVHQFRDRLLSQTNANGSHSQPWFSYWVVPQSTGAQPTETTNQPVHPDLLSSSQQHKWTHICRHVRCCRSMVLIFLTSCEPYYHSVIKNKLHARAVPMPKRWVSAAGVSIYIYIYILKIIICVVSIFPVFFNRKYGIDGSQKPMECENYLKLFNCIDIS